MIVSNASAQVREIPLNFSTTKFQQQPIFQLKVDLFLKYVYGFFWGYINNSFLIFDLFVIDDGVYKNIKFDNKLVEI
jgi:hypothetical protein